MKTVAFVLSAFLLVGGAVYVISDPKAGQAIESAFGGASGLVQNVRTASGLVWLVSYAALWILLIFLVDAGMGELAEVLAGVIFITVLGANIDKLQAGFKALGG